MAVSTIVYAELGPAAAQSPAAVAQLIAKHAKDSLAAGQFDVHYGLDYHDYRRADVTTKVTVPKGR